MTRARVLELLCWWAALSVVWLGTLSTANPVEVLAAVAGGGLGAVVAVVARAALGASWPPSTLWLRWAARLPGAVLADTGRVLFGRSRATTRELRVARGDTAVAAALVNAAPATVVTAARDATLVLHALGDKASRFERGISR